MINIFPSELCQKTVCNSVLLKLKIQIISALVIGISLSNSLEFICNAKKIMTLKFENCGNFCLQALILGDGAVPYYRIVIIN
jgi:hypothetical protein